MSSRFDTSQYDMRNPAEFQWMLRAAQKAGGWSEPQFATVLGIPPHYLHQWKNAPPSKRYREALRTMVKELFP